jgi:DNA-binding MarR family transcriptional regulator
VTSETTEAPKRKTHLPSTLRFILTNVQDNPNCSPSELSELTGFSQSVVSSALRALVDSGEVYTPDATSGRDHPKRYTAKQLSEVAKLRAKLAEAYDLLAQQRADKADNGEVAELRERLQQAFDMVAERNTKIAELAAFKAKAIELYPELGMHPQLKRAREIYAAQFKGDEKMQKDIIDGYYDTDPAIWAVISVLEGAV